MTIFNVEAEISRLVSVAKLKKEEAKDFRETGDVASAIAVLEEAIATLDRSPLSERLLENGAPSDAQKKLAFHLADCLGMLGGNHRRLDHFPAALAAFVRGRRLEESESLAVPSSYNLVNAITLPLESDGRMTPEQEAALKRAIAAIQRQVKLEERRNDRWAWEDLGECQLLLGDLDGAKTSYRRVAELGNADTRASVIAVLERLQKALEADAKTSAALKQGIEWMKS